jgi:hypothetical protein
MDFLLIVAILALLGWTLLPQLDRFVEADATDDRQTTLGRFARWVNN